MSLLDLLLQLFVQLLGHGGLLSLEDVVPVLSGEVVADLALQLLEIQLERVLALLRAARIIAVQRPVAALHSGQ